MNPLRETRTWTFVPLLMCGIALSLLAQDAPTNPDKKVAAEAAASKPPTDSKPEAPKDPNAPPANQNSGSATSEKSAASTNLDSQAKSDKPDEIQVSFQGANIDMIVQWLAQTTGKSVVKHPQVQCQLTIMSSKKLATREAISLVYRAMSLEGAVAIESSNTILIVPEGKEPKMNPELLEGSRKDIPEGRQRLVKMFPLAHMQAADLREKLRSVLSDKGTIEADDRANQLIATDYNDNLRLIADLIKEFDVPASGLVLQIYALKYGEAEEVGNLISLILNAQAGPASGGRAPSSGSSRGSPMSMGGPMPGGPSPGDMGGASSPPPSGGGASPGGGASGQALRIWPDKNANRLVVSAPKSRLVELERVLAVLDVEKPADVAVRVLPLKHVNAVDLVKEVGPLYQKMSGRSPKEAVDVAASDRSNSLIVLSSEANFQAIEKLVASLDTEDATEKVVRTFLLKNADAQDVAKQLQELNRDQDNSSRYPYYYYFGSSSQNQNKSRKMSVVADRRRNSLVIQAPPTEMDGIEKMIEDLDAPVSDDSLAPRIYALKYVSAVDIEDVLNELFLKKTQQRNYYFFDDYQEPQADRDVGRLYGKVRITSEPYSNTLIVTSNSKENLAVVEEVLKQLDVPSQAGETTLRVPLKFAKAPNVANSINILFAKNGSPLLRPGNPQNPQQPNNPQPQNPQQGGVTQTSFTLEQETKEEGYYPWLGGPQDNPRSSDSRSTARPVSDLVGRVRAVADQRSNSLLITANVHFFPQVMKLIEELDAPTAQVLIEARVVEVSDDYLDKLGVRWSPDGSKVFTADDYDNSLLAHVSADYQKGFGKTETVNGPPTLGSALTQVRSGVLNSTINMDFLIQFLRKTTGAKVIAEPQINIADNEMGKLFVGQRVPFISQSQTYVGQLSQSFTYTDVGVILEVTPHINSAGDVALRIRTEASSIVPGQTLFGGAIIDARDFRTDLKAKSGETLVLGGIIQRQVSDTLRKTPILGDIPGLGWAFKKRDKTTRNVELMVFLRPKITRTTEESKELLEDTYKKAPGVKDWNEAPPPSSEGKGTDKH